MTLDQEAKRFLFIVGSYLAILHVMGVLALLFWDVTGLIVVMLGIDLLLAFVVGLNWLAGRIFPDE